MTVKIFQSNVAFMESDLVRMRVGSAKERLRDVVQKIGDAFPSAAEVEFIKAVAERVQESKIRETRPGDIKRIVAFAENFRVTDLGVVWSGKGEFHEYDTLWVTPEGEMVAVFKQGNKVVCIKVSDQEIIDSVKRFCFSREEDINDEREQIRYRIGLVAEYGRRLNK